MLLLKTITKMIKNMGTASNIKELSKWPIDIPD
jgi:hypothetical protein